MGLTKWIEVQQRIFVFVVKKWDKIVKGRVVPNEPVLQAVYKA